jgi:hypothetical protein
MSLVAELGGSFDGLSQRRSDAGAVQGAHPLVDGMRGEISLPRRFSWHQTRASVESTPPGDGGRVAV